MSIFAAAASAITPASALALPSSSAASSAAGSGPSFGDMLQGALTNVNSLQNQASTMAQNFAVGKSSDVQGVMVSIEKATIALQLTTQVRNKIVDAYQQVMQISM